MTLKIMLYWKKKKIIRRQCRSLFRAKKPPKTSKCKNIFKANHIYPCIQEMKEESGRVPASQIFTRCWLDWWVGVAREVSSLRPQPVLSPLFLPLWPDAENSSTPSFNQELSSMTSSSVALELPLQLKELHSWSSKCHWYLASVYPLAYMPQWPQIFLLTKELPLLSLLPVRVANTLCHSDSEVHGVISEPILFHIFF